MIRRIEKKDQSDDKNKAKMKRRKSKRKAGKKIIVRLRLFFCGVIDLCFLKGTIRESRKLHLFKDE